jgi:hypothetical protein
MTPVKSPLPPYNRARRAKLLLDNYRSTEKYVLLYASEGFGKSYLAALIARPPQEPQPNEFGALPDMPQIGGGKVVFACSQTSRLLSKLKDSKLSVCECNQSSLVTTGCT